MNIKEFTSCNQPNRHLSAGEIDELLHELSAWQLVQHNKLNVLCKTYQFENFATALAFTNQVGEFAEQVNHHPEITLSWGSVTIIWYTHTMQGIQPNDFRCAAYCDELYTLIP